MNEFLKANKVSYIETNNAMSQSSFCGFYPSFEFIYDIICKYGGMVFNKGLFKIHTFEYIKKWTELITQNYFKNELKERNLQNIICFGSNWQGCMYCINSTNNTIVYFDPATCEFFSAKDIPIHSFFNNILVDAEYDVIAEEYFQEVCNFHKLDKLEYSESFGHKIYLHLGGEDDAHNYEIIDTEVLWELQMQVAERINEF